MIVDSFGLDFFVGFAINKARRVLYRLMLFGAFYWFYIASNNLLLGYMAFVGAYGI